MGFIGDRVKTFLNISENSISFDDLDKNIIDLPTNFDWQISFKIFLEKWISGLDRFDIQTSGSTGEPKLISVSREDLKRSAKYTLDFLKLKQGMNALNCLPIEFVAGKMMLLRSIVGKLNCYVVKPSADPLFDVEYDVDFVAITPYQLHDILKNPESKEKLNRIKVVIIGGAAINENDRKLISAMDPESYLSYGMTETLTHIAMCPLKGSLSLSAFKLIHEDFSIEVNKMGQLKIRSPYKHAELIETNDIAELTSSNSFLLKGRSDNVINSGGIKIHPEEIESLLSEYISTPFFVTGISSDSFGERVTLVVEVGDSAAEKIQNLEELIKEINIDNKHKPRAIVMLSRFVYTDSGKINRNETVKLINR